MNNLFYCNECKRIFDGDKCAYCSNDSIKPLNLGAPVNVIGTKLKGKVLKITDDNVRLLIKDELKNKYIKEFKAEELRKLVWYKIYKL